MNDCLTLMLHASVCVEREIDVTHKCTLCFIFSVCIMCMLFFVPLYSTCYLNTNPVFIKCDLFFSHLQGMLP